MMEQSVLPPFNQAARSVFTFMAEAYSISRQWPMGTAHIPKDVSLLPKSAKRAGCNTMIPLKLAAVAATNHVKHLAITV
jgi:hypothetical protein